MTANPLGTLAAIYEFIGERLFGHDPLHIAPCHEMVEFDARLGTPGLHEVGSSVKARTRTTVLPPDLFKRHEKGAFWDDPTLLPKTVHIV
jgi:sulfotransferase